MRPATMRLRPVAMRLPPVTVTLRPVAMGLHPGSDEADFLGVFDIIGPEALGGTVVLMTVMT